MGRKEHKFKAKNSTLKQSRQHYTQVKLSLGHKINSLVIYYINMTFMLCLSLNPFFIFIYTIMTGLPPLTVLLIILVN